MSNELTQQDKDRIAEIEKIIAPLKHFELNEATGHMWSFLCRPDVSQAIVKMFDGEKKKVCEQPDNEAKTKEVEQKERWQPTYGCKYWYIGIEDGNIFISDFHWGNDDVDFIYHDTANCFKTQEEAERAVQAIRETLKQL